MNAYDPGPARDLMERIGGGGLWRHVAELAVLGYTVIPDVLSASEVRSLRARATNLLECDAGVDDECGRRVWSLLRRDRCFARLLVEPRVDPLLDYLVGEARTLSSLHVNAVASGAPAQATHTDVPFVSPPLGPGALLANTIWCLDDWSNGRGATEVVPGCHFVGSHPASEPTGDDIVPVECKAGSVIVAHGHLWHRSGSHDATGATEPFRIGILALYCRSYLRPQEDYSDLVPGLAFEQEAVARRLTSPIPYPFDDSGPDDRFAQARALASSPFL